MCRWVRVCPGGNNCGLILCGVDAIAAGIGLALGKQIAYLFWTIGISLTWYVYPLLMTLFKKKLGRMASAPRRAR